jgi:tetratricopeptide (TPR) repeat protein
MRLTLVFIYLTLSSILLGQNNQLANEYFRNGEYEKAAVMFKSLIEKSKGTNEYQFSRYLECLVALQRFDEAKEVVEKELKKRPRFIHNYVHLGNILEKQGHYDQAEKKYAEAIKKMPNDQYLVSHLANAFTRINKIDLAIQVYEKGEEVTQMGDLFAYQMADLYRRQGNQSKMIEKYLDCLRTGRINIENAKKLLSRYLEKDEYGELQTQLFIQIQDYPDALIYLELLEWVYIQNKDYDKALRQAKAIDKRSNGGGIRVFNLASVASNAGDYDAALKAYDYIVKEIGNSSTYYIDARKEFLHTLRDKIVKGRKFNQEELIVLRDGYEAFVEELGSNGQTAQVLTEWAELEALYLDNVSGAIEILEKVTVLSSINRFILNNAKLDLGDYYLITGEIWEATLLYSQVDKEFREDYLGELARYKNAKLYYYNGDFEWSQAQFDILKSATSRLISNDAIDQSVFIMDNLGLDTTPVPLQMYARAELLSFQNKYDEAFAVLDSIILMFEGHQLQDDIWYLKAKTYSRQRNYDKAIEMYTAVYTNYPEDIRADNSIMELANLYDIYLGDKDKAMPLYEMLFTEYTGSTLAVDARKKFRILRGDLIQ